VACCLLVAVVVVVDDVGAVFHWLFRFL